MSVDRWRDAAAGSIPPRCRVEQVGVAAWRGARRARLGRHGTVVGRRFTRLMVRFDGEFGWVSLRPHLVRVLPERPDDSAVLDGLERILADLEQLRATLPTDPGAR